MVFGKLPKTTGWSRSGGMLPRNLLFARGVALTTREPPLYSARVTVFARSGPSRTGITETALPLGPLTRVARLVQPHLDEVESRIVEQTAAFDPAIEGYVTYAIG